MRKRSPGVSSSAKSVLHFRYRRTAGIKHGTPGLPEARVENRKKNQHRLQEILHFRYRNGVYDEKALRIRKILSSNIPALYRNRNQLDSNDVSSFLLKKKRDEILRVDSSHEGFRGFACNPFSAPTGVETFLWPFEHAMPGIAFCIVANTIHPLTLLLSFYTPQ